MEHVPVTHWIGHLAGSIARCVLIAIVLPLAAALLLSIPIPSTIALITTTFVIEYGAAPIGIGLGLHPLFVLIVLIFVALGVTLALFEIFDTIGEHSERMARFLEISEEHARRSRILSEYGVYGLVLCVLTLGFYICPPVSWMFGWRRDISLLLIMAGYTAISIVTILLSLGIFDLILK